MNEADALSFKLIPAKSLCEVLHMRCPKCKLEIYSIRLESKRTDVFYCKSCRKTFDLIIRESKIPFEKIEKMFEDFMEDD